MGSMGLRPGSIRREPGPRSLTVWPTAGLFIMAMRLPVIRKSAKAAIIGINARNTHAMYLAPRVLPSLSKIKLNRLVLRVKSGKLKSTVFSFSSVDCCDGCWSWG